MWKTMQNSDVCAFFEGDLLTVIDREGNVRFADWTDRDRQSVPKELRPSTGELLKHTIRQVLPAGEELWVLTANTWMPEAFAQMQLVRLDRELRELGRQELCTLDNKLDYPYVRFRTAATPNHLLTAEMYFRVGFVSQLDIGAYQEDELKDGVQVLYLYWKALPDGEDDEWALDISEVTGRLPGGEDELDSFQDIEAVMARGNRLWILAELTLHPWG